MEHTTKQVKLILPEILWKAIRHKANKERTSLQTIIVESLLDKYGLTHWRRPTTEEGFKRAVDDIVKHYEHTLPTMRLSATKNNDPDYGDDAISKMERLLDE